MSVTPEFSGESGRTRILYLNVHDVTYPRNMAVRDDFSQRNCEVIVVPRRDMPFFLLAWIGLVVRACKLRGPFHLVVLSEFSIQYALSAKIVSLRFRSTLVIDAFIGLYESLIEDWGWAHPKSIRARCIILLDKIAASLADVLLIDTLIRRDALAAHTKTPVVALPVGAPHWAQPLPPDITPKKQTRVLYYGNYIPLHGLSYIIDNLGALRRKDNFEFVFIGEGSLRAGIEFQSERLGLNGKIVFRDAVPTGVLIEEIHAADVVLGVFGDSPKAASVLANKVWQGLASGRRVLTRSSDALSELSMVNSEQLIAVDVTDPFALTKALEEISAEDGNNSAYFENSRMRLDEYVQYRFDVAAGILGLSTKKI